MRRCRQFHPITYLALSFIILSLSFIAPTPTLAQSATLINLQDIINDTTPGGGSVYHSLSFTLPPNALSIRSTDYIHISLPTFSNVTAPTLVGGDSTGTPVFSANGTTASVTGINVLPNRRITIEGFTATNPPSQPFTVTVTVTQDQAGLIVKNVSSTQSVAFPGTVEVSANVAIPQGVLQISGFSAPDTIVLFSKSDVTSGTDVVGPTGVFSKIFYALPPGDSSFNIFGIDTYDRSTSIVSLDVFLPEFQTTTVSNILLSPTIQISTPSAIQGDPIVASGSAYPGSSITLFTDTPLRSYVASAGANGDWSATITDTSSYTVGDYRIYSIAQAGGGLQSLFSPSLLFTILSSGGGGGTACGDISQGDLNCDTNTDLTDFSILMFYWGTSNATADINGDGTVDLTDFSIMMFYWGT